MDTDVAWFTVHIFQKYLPLGKRNLFTSHMRKLHVPVVRIGESNRNRLRVENSKVGNSAPFKRNMRYGLNQLNTFFLRMLPRNLRAAPNAHHAPLPAKPAG